MKIGKIELKVVSIPLINPFETSFGVENEEVHIIVKIYSEGLTGFGESPVMANPGYSYETVETAWHIMKDFLIPSILNKDINDITDFERLTGGIRGHNFAKHGLEGAVWDLLSKRDETPLYKMLGGSKKIVNSGVSIGIKPTINELLDAVGGFLEEGYKRIKIKIKPGWDVEPVKAIRMEFGSIPLMVDANSAYTPGDLEILQALDDFDLMMIEQPLFYNDLTAHAALQEQLSTPICLDESISSVSMAEAALELKSCKIINIKPGRVGGLNNAKRIHDLCLNSGIPVWCGGMLEMGIGRAQNIAISTLENFRFPGDVSSSTKYFHKDIVTPVILFKNGALKVSESPGTGYTPDEKTIEEFSIRSYSSDDK